MLNLLLVEDNANLRAALHTAAAVGGLDKLKVVRSTIPAVTHVDGTARPQTVNEKTNPLYWRVIKEFGNISGVPVVLNTSFNIMGEPIVCTPPQAIRCFYGTGIDALAIGSYLVQKPRA